MANQGITNAANNLVVNPANRQLLGDISAPRGINLTQFREGIPTLTKTETKCLMIQLGSLESNNTANLVTLGNPNLGIFKSNLVSNVAVVTITNSDNTDIKLGMVANIQFASVGVFGTDSSVIEKSTTSNVSAANIIPGFTYTITSVGSTDFTLIGALGNTIGDTFTANATGAGTGTATGINNQIILASDHQVAGDVMFSVSPLKLGKYQNSQWFLTKYNYMSNSGSWIGVDGVDSDEIFLSAAEIQDNLMRNFIQEQYVDLIKAGAIRIGDSKEIVAGMLALAYQYQDLGNPQLKQPVYNTNGTINLENYSIATRANAWRETGQTVDSQGRPGHIYFNGGRYAIRNLGADVPE